MQFTPLAQLRSHVQAPLAPAQLLAVLAPA